MARKKKQPAQRTGVIYARYSSHNQKDASIEQQVEQCQKFAREQGISIIDIYADRAVSGKTDKRPAFQQMMKDAPNGRFNCVIAWKSNRIGRNMLQAMINEARLDELGVRCLYTEESFDDTAAGRFALRSMMNVNQFYSENMAEDVIRGMYDNAQNCKANGRLPLGYAADENLKWVIDDLGASVVQEIFTRIAAGETYAEIARDLNARGLKTASGAKWGRSSFHTIVHNERYKGIYLFGDVRTEGGIPRIISDELYDKVQAVLKMKKTKSAPVKKGEYLLTGKLFCGECKSPMVGTSGTSKNGELHYYYACRKRMTEKKCTKNNVRREEIERAVAKAIYDYALKEDVLEWIADYTVAYFKQKRDDSHIDILYERLSEKKRAIKNMLDAIEKGIITETTKKRLLELEQERTEIETQISAAKSEIIDVSKEDIMSGLALCRNGNIEDKKFQSELFQTFLVAVYVYDDHLKLVFSFTGDNNTLELPLAASAVEKIEEGAAVSNVRTLSPMNHQRGAVRTQIYAEGNMFVLVCPLLSDKKATL